MCKITIKIDLFFNYFVPDECSFLPSTCNSSLLLCCKYKGENRTSLKFLLISHSLRFSESKTSLPLQPPLFLTAVV